MKVKDVMTQEVRTLPADIAVSEAMKILSKEKISGLPVVDAQGKLIGMFTEKDILGFILPHYIERVGKFVYEEDSRITKNKFLELNQLPVNRLMRKEVVTVSQDVSICELAKNMLMQKVRRVPVVDASGKLIGIVSRNDILEALAKQSQDIK